MMEILNQLTIEQIEFICRECEISKEKLFNTYEFYDDVYNPLSDAEILAILEDPRSERCKMVIELINIFADTMEADEENLFIDVDYSDFNDDPDFYKGISYQMGIDVEVNYNKALWWYHKGIRNNSMYCCNQLGVLYGRGLGVKKNSRTALKYYLKAGSSGLAVSYRNAGCLYERGELGPPDLNEAMKYYKLAAVLGDNESKEWLENIEMLIREWEAGAID